MEEAKKKAEEQRNKEEQGRKRKQEAQFAEYKKEKKQKAKRELAVKMEAAGEAQVQRFSNEGFANLGIDITDDEQDDGNLLEDEQKKELSRVDEEEMNGKERVAKQSGMSLDIVSPVNQDAAIVNDDEENGDCERRVPFGSDLYHYDVSSEKSSTSASTSFVCRKLLCISSKQTDKTPQKQLSTQDVQMLSDPDLLKTLEAFPGLSKGENVQTDILASLKILKILQSVLSVGKMESEDTEMQEDKDILATPLTSTPLMNTHNIKVEGNPRKRKLLSFKDFKAVWKVPVKRGKKSVTSSTVGHSVGSPNKGSFQ